MSCQQLCLTKEVDVSLAAVLQEPSKVLYTCYLQGPRSSRGVLQFEFLLVTKIEHHPCLAFDEGPALQSTHIQLMGMLLLPYSLSQFLHACHRCYCFTLCAQLVCQCCRRLGFRLRSRELRCISQRSNPTTTTLSFLLCYYMPESRSRQRQQQYYYLLLLLSYS